MERESIIFEYTDTGPSTDKSVLFRLRAGEDGQVEREIWLSRRMIKRRDIIVYPKKMQVSIPLWLAHRAGLVDRERS